MNYPVCVKSVAYTKQTPTTTYRYPSPTSTFRLLRVLAKAQAPQEKFGKSIFQKIWWKCMTNVSEPAPTLAKRVISIIVSSAARDTIAA